MVRLENKKSKARVSVFFILGALCSTAFASGSSSNTTDSKAQIITIDVNRIANLEELIAYKSEENPDALLTENFVRHFLQGLNIKEGTIIQGEKIDEGGFGIVFKAHQNGNTFVIKYLQQGKSIHAMSNEFLRSKQMVCSVNQYVKDPDNKDDLWGKLLGLGIIVPVIGRTKNGEIIQEYTGMNLQEATRNDHDFFNEDGFPQSPQAALQALCSFLHALTTLHALGYVHCDLGPENVIFTKEGTIKIIDLGFLTKIGRKITACDKRGRLKTFHGHRIGISKDRLAHLACDMYRSIRIILGCLFGSKGLGTNLECLRPQFDEEGKIVPFIDCISTISEQNTQDCGVGNPLKYWADKIEELNQDMA
ncbi:MAG: hypothetical protein LW808_003270 [Verrucomicrobiota bacterium]|nr:MAG: hypothetical protein LW808_003270 [Verrucomicrobiota bacterium]